MTFFQNFKKGIPRTSNYTVSENTQLSPETFGNGNASFNLRHTTVHSTPTPYAVGWNGLACDALRINMVI